MYHTFCLGELSLHLNVLMPSLRINMNYPSNKTELGTLTAQDLKLTIQVQSIRYCKS